MNKTFIVLALLVTFGYIIYYAVTIARDIVKSKKTKGGEVETFETGGEGDDGESSGFESAVGGDCEIESLIETLETITSNLKNMKNKIFIEESNKILEKLDNSERKEVFGMINKKINEMNKAKKYDINNS